MNLFVNSATALIFILFLSLASHLADSQSDGASNVNHTINACYFDTSATQEQIQDVIDSGTCRLSCPPESTDEMCEYFQSNYVTTDPSIGVFIAFAIGIILAIGIGVGADHCGKCGRVKDSENSNGRPAFSDTEYRSCGVFTTVLVIAIVIIGSSSVYFNLRLKQTEFDDAERSFKIVAFERNDGTYGFSPLFSFEYAQNKKIHYMRATERDLQQSERIMTKNLIDLPSAYALLHSNELLRFGATDWGGPWFWLKIDLRVDRENLHNSELCLIRQGPNEQVFCQSKLYTPAILFTVFSGLAILVFSCWFLSILFNCDCQ